MKSVVRYMLAMSVALAALCASPAAFALDTGDIVVASLKGEVHVTIAGAERVMKAGSVLETPATVRTGADGTIELKQGATSVRVGPDSQLDFPAIETRGGSIDRVVQPRGNAFYSIGKRAGHKLRVETPFLVGVVKGTQFNVASQDESTTISLFEGLLEVRAADDSDVIELNAGEIATRKRGDKSITKLKMDGKLPTNAPRPAAPGGSGSTDNSAPASAAPVAAPRPPRNTTDGDSLLAGRDGTNTAVAVDSGRAATVTVSTPGASVDSGASLDVGASGANAGVNVNVNAATPVAVADVGTNIVVGATGADVGVNVNAATPVGSLDVGVNLDAGATGVGAGVSVGVDTPAASVDVVAGVNVGASGLSVDVGAAAAAPLGTDLSTSANLDVAPGAVDVSAGAALDTGPVSANVGADTSIVADGHGVNAAVAVDVNVIPGAGPALVETSVTTGVDLGTGSTGPAADVNVNVGANVVGVDTGIAAAVNASTGTIDLGLNVAGLNVGVGMNLGPDNTSAPNTTTTTPTVETPVTAPVVDVTGLLNGLLRRKK